MRFAVVAAAVSLFFASGKAFAGEEPEHYHLVYVLARTVGFDDNEARILAAASWSVDLNNDTTAYEAARGDIEKVTKFLTDIAFSDRTDETAAQELFSDRGLLAHAPKGMMYHALGSEAARRAVDANWQRLIREASSAGREARLVLTGMYLHFVVDRYVHPPDAILGHFFQNVTGHTPDRAINNPAKFQTAAGDVFSILKSTALAVGGRDGKGRQINVDARLKALGLDSPENRQDYYSRIVSALSKAYRVPDVNAADVAAQQLGTDIGKTFSRIGESLEVLPIEEPANKKKHSFTYSAGPGGSLVISGTLLSRGAELRIKDPVASIKAANASDGLAVARRDLVDQVKTYYSDSLVVAASAPGAGLRVNLVAARGADIAIRQATEEFARARQQVGTLYNRSRDAGVRIYQRSADGTLRVWQRTGDKIQLLEQKVGQQVALYEAPLRSAVAVIGRDPAVGGIRLGYGSDILGILLSRSNDIETSFLRVDEPIRLVSLRSLLGAIRAAGGQLERMDPSARSLAGITRIYGYLIDPGTKDVVLIGGHVVGGQPIRADDLVVGLRQVYRDGDVPMISLDPDPTNFTGPQKVRLIGISGNTHFAKVMVEADYEMKKIIFGAMPLTAGSFRSASDLMLDRVQQGADPSGRSRYWLTPIQPGPSDIHVSPANDAALFLARIQLLTEALELTSGGLTGTGAADPISEEAARLFTANYQTIAAQRPLFRTLEGLNEIVLLASILRKALVKEKVLQELAGVDIRTSDPPLPSSFPAVAHTQHRSGNSVTIVGGVNLRPVAVKSKWARYNDQQLARLRTLSARLAASGQLYLDTGLDSLIISAPRGTRGEAEQLVERGAQKLAARQYKEADSDFSRAIELDATLTEAYVGRAMANARLGNSRRAFRDARKALELDPQDDDVAAMKLAIGLESGQDLSVVFDAADATPVARSRAASLFIKRGVARAAARRAKDAEQDFAWALALEPKNAEAYMLRGALKVELAVAGSGTKTFDEHAPQAFADLNRAIQLNPGLGSAYAARSKLKAFSFDYSGADKDASNAIRLDPSDAASYSYRGIARAYLKRVKESWDDLSKAIELAPHDGRMYFNRGLVRVLAKDKDGAIEDFASAIERDPTLIADIKKIMDANGMVGVPGRKER